jgi:hypothetical protein
MSHLKDDDYVPWLLKMIRNELERGETLYVHEMQSWAEYADQIELAMAYLAKQLKLGLVVKSMWPREHYMATDAMRKLEDDDYIPSVLETVRNDLERGGEILYVHHMRSWTDDADQIELATAYLADRLKRGRVVRIRWPREGYLATREVQWWVESGSVVRIGDELMALCDAESLLGI